MKKWISLCLALLLLITCVPAVSAAEVPSVTVYFTVSKDRDFKTINAATLALYEITVPYFDLELYGLEEFYYNPDCYDCDKREDQKAGTKETAYGNVTMLHLYIYATEVLYHGLSPAKAGKGWLADEGGWKGFSVSGDIAGSTYCVFWDYGNDANYYLNYEYPLGREDWGASCDQVVLQDGDVVSIRYTYYPKTYPNGEGIYHHFGGAENSWLTAEQGDLVELDLYIAVCNYDVDHVTTQKRVNTVANIYATKDAAPKSHATANKVGTTDSNGHFTLDTSSLEPGVYYITADTWDPAVVILEVFEDEQSSVKYGDLTDDGEVDVFDASRAYSIVNGKREASAAEKASIDVNGDGDIDVFDAAMIYSYANGKRTSFPAEKQ